MLETVGLKEILMRRFWCSLLSVVLLAGGVAGADVIDEAVPDQSDKIEFRLRLQTGQVFLLQTTTASKITQIVREPVSDGKSKTPASPLKMEINSSTALGMEYRVTGIDGDGNASVRLTYKSAVLKSQSRLGSAAATKTEYDSTSPPKVIPAVARPLAALIGQTVSIKLGPDGSVRAMQGMEALMTKMLNKFAPAERKIVEPMLKQQFSEASMKEMYQPGMTSYPSHAVGIGDAWNQKITLTKGFPLTMSNTMTLRERRAGLAFIDIISTITFNQPAAGMAVGEARVHYDLKGQQQGTMEIDEATGMVVRLHLSQRFAGPITVNGGGAPAGALSQMYSKTDISMTATKVSSP